MAAAAAEKRKRLPKYLQEYKRELQKLSFEEKLKAYFDCSPFLNEADTTKRKIILRSFSKKELAEFFRKYSPIHSSIERYSDRLRAINGYRIIYGNYITQTLRQIDTYNYTADFLNLLLKQIPEGESGELVEVSRLLKKYRGVSFTTTKIKYNTRRNKYEVSIEEEEEILEGAIKTLIGIVSLLKSYLEALKEFLEWVGTPQLLPREFQQMEDELRADYKKVPQDQTTSPDIDKFPLFFAEKSEVVKEFYSIDYETLPRGVDIFGDNNIFANHYRGFFKY